MNKLFPNKYRRPMLIYTGFSLILLVWFLYAGLTGYRIFNNEGKKDAWSSSGPGYHK